MPQRGSAIPIGLLLCVADLVLVSFFFWRVATVNVNSSAFVVIVVTAAASALASAASAGTYSTAVLASGPTAYYQMDSDPTVYGDSLVDSSGNGNDGTWGSLDSTATTPSIGTPTSGVAGGAFGGLDAGNVGANFGGNNAADGKPADVMDLLADGTFDNAQATVAFLMATGGGGNDGRIFTTGSSDANQFKIVYGTSDFFAGVGHDFAALAISTGDFAPKQIRSSVFSFDTGGLNNWAHVVVVRNDGVAANSNIYVNGVDLTASLSVVGDSYGTTDTSAHIGARRESSNTAGNGGYEGNLDEFAYWNRALSANEVAGLYSALTVPEPSSVLLSVLGLLGVVGARRRS